MPSKNNIRKPTTICRGYIEEFGNITVSILTIMHLWTS